MHSEKLHKPTARWKGRGRWGSSLIELLVVIAVMAVMMSVLLPSLAQAREESRRTVCMANMKQIGAAVFNYSATHHENGPMVMLPVAARAPRQLLSTPGQLVNLGLMWPRNAGEPGVFLCPSQRQFAYSADIHKLRADTVGGSYVYAVHVPTGQSPKLGAIRHLAMAADDFMAGAEGVGVGESVHRFGYNVLYTDGSVGWYNDADRSIAKRGIQWPTEPSNYTYQQFLANSYSTGGYYGKSWRADMYQVWKSFCYSRKDPF